MRPLVSAIIPNYNYERYVGKAVESALAQTYQNIEIIVVDDGSDDKSRELLTQYSDRIKVIEQKNSGVCAARNRGAAESNGDYLAFLDADDIWMPEKIKRQVDRFTCDPQIGIVHVGVEDIDADGNNIAFHLKGMEGNVSEHFLFFEEAVVLGGGSGVMIKRSVFEESGGFDETLSTSADWELYFRISSKYSIAFVAEPLLQYRLHGSNMHSNVQRMEQEMIRAYEKAFDGSSFSDSVKSKAYGRLFRVLSGSYFRAGNFSDFSRTAITSLKHDPKNITYFLRFPIRAINRHR